MKKNLLNGLLLLAVASAGVGTFSSCTDDNGDELSISQAETTARMDEMGKQIKEQIDALKDCQKKCKEDRESLEKQLNARIDELEKLVTKQQTANKEEHERLEKRIDDLNESIEKFKNEVIIPLDQKVKELEGRINTLEKLNGKIEELEDKIKNLGDQEIDVEIPGQAQSKMPLDKVIENIFDLIEANKTATKDLIDSLQLQIDEINEALEGCASIDDINDLNDALNAAVLDINGNLINNYVTKDELNKQLEEIKADFKEDLKKEVDALEEKIDKNYDTLEQMIINECKALSESFEKKIKELDEKYDGKYTDLANKYLKLSDDLTRLKEDLQNKINALDKKAQDGVDALIWINENKARLDALEAADKDINKVIKELIAKDTDLQSQINGLGSKIQEEVEKLVAVDTDLQKQIDEVKGDITKLTNDLADNITIVNNKIKDIDDKVNGLDDKIDKEAAKAEEKINLLNETLGGRIDVIDGKIVSFEKTMGELQDQVKANTAAIENINNKMKTIESKLTNLDARLNKLVTGIINQATTNPVFGSFNIPANVRSNMLITYYGTASHNYTFPSYSSASEYNGKLVLTAKDMQMLQSSGNFKSFTMTEGEMLMDKEAGNAGMVFLTINPNNVDFTGMNLPLVNSQDQESGMKLLNLKKSDKVLHFGYTRAANNGFYEAQATVAPADVNKIAVKVEPGLKSAFKNALNNHGKKDFVELAKVLYHQVSDILPANGLKASWTAPDANGNMKEYAVYSNYDIAATAVAPLSFKFMEGESIDHELPIITPLSEFEFDKSKFTFDIDVPKFVINDVELNFHLDNVDITESGDIFVEIEVPTKVDAEGNVIATEIKKYNLKDDINKVLDQVEADVNGTIGKWNASIEKDFKEALKKLTDDIEDQVDKMMKDVTGQIDSNLENLIDQINKEVHDALGGYFDKANKVIDKYNSLANKINARLKNPNNYLQSMACYKGTDGDFHQLSNAIAMPSPFVLGSGNAITIYMTTYNAEIIVPSYKKFIGVTNVWNEKTGKSAQDGDGECLQLLKAANSQQFMNQAISGKQKRVAFAASKAGFKYEIVYSALDYRGWASTRKYYVSVK